MGIIWPNLVLWASLWQPWCDLLICLSLEYVDFINHLFFPFSNVVTVLSNVSGAVSIQIKTAYKRFLVFSSQWHILLLYQFSSQSIWGLNNLSVSNCVHNVCTFLCAVNAVASGNAMWGQGCEEVWMGVWNIISALLQQMPAARSCPASQLLHCGLALQHLIFCTHAGNFPLWGTGTPCCRHVPLRGWADVLEHINFVLRRAQCSSHLFFSLEEEDLELRVFKNSERQSALSQNSEGSERRCDSHSRAAKPRDSRCHLLALHSWLRMRCHVQCQGQDLVLNNVSQAC